jgi:hypothetical protein
MKINFGRPERPRMIDENAALSGVRPAPFSRWLEWFVVAETGRHAIIMMFILPSLLDPAS